jgi:RimJ/RimL family protein N-acetyltransferase
MEQAAMPNEHLFQGKLVRFAAPQRSEIDKIVAWWGDSEYLGNLMIGMIMPQTVEEAQRWFDQRVNAEHNWFQPPNPNWQIRTLANDNLIGFFALNEVDWKNMSCWVAIGIGDRAYWSRGYGTDAMRIGLRYAFLEMGLNRVQLMVFAFNERAIGSYKKVGFQIEGIRRQAIYRDGKFNDVVHMSMLRPEWEALSDDQR